MTNQINPIKVINTKVNGTDIFVFNYNPENKLYTYSRPFNVGEAKFLVKEFNQAVSAQYNNANGLREGLSVDNRTGEIFNMNTLKGILANRLLMNKTDGKQWLPTIKEGIQLQKQDMLPSGFLIDFGIALYLDFAS